MPFDPGLYRKVELKLAEEGKKVRGNNRRLEGKQMKAKPIVSKLTGMVGLELEGWAGMAGERASMKA